MSINYQVVVQQVRDLIQSRQQKLADLAGREALAWEVFKGYLPDPLLLSGKIELARQADPGLRCAQPTAEAIHTHLPAPELSDRTILIASDGSQIMPDRHQASTFGLINIGAIVFRLNSGLAPDVLTDSRLLAEDELITSSGMPVSDTILGLMRDTRERVILADLVEQTQEGSSQIITLTDGPIELWGRRDGDEGPLFVQHLKNYLSALGRVQAAGGLAAGYIDRPGANPVCRMLEVLLAGEEDLDRFRHYHPLEGISDRWLFANPNAPLLGVGERSAVFSLKSRSESDYQGILGLHFFYINVSQEPSDPQFARVDIPRWVAEDADKVGQLHAAIIAQCTLLGAKPFPYILHRAHEIAVVSFDEKKQIDALFQIESLSQNSAAGSASNKQTVKDGAGRTKFRP